MSVYFVLWTLGTPLDVFVDFFSHGGPPVVSGDSDATARLKMAEPAKLSHFEPSQAIKLAHNQNRLGLAHELAQPS